MVNFNHILRSQVTFFLYAIILFSSGFASMAQAESPVDSFSDVELKLNEIRKKVDDAFLPKDLKDRWEKQLRQYEKQTLGAQLDGVLEGLRTDVDKTNVNATWARGWSRELAKDLYGKAEPKHLEDIRNEAALDGPVLSKVRLNLDVNAQQEESLQALTAELYGYEYSGSNGLLHLQKNEPAEINQSRLDYTEVELKRIESLTTVLVGEISNTTSVNGKEDAYLKESRLDKLTEDLKILRENNVALAAQTAQERIFRNNLWILIAAILVFLMQPGFKCLEVGLLRRQHRDGIALKNLLDLLVVVLGFSALGFGLVFGKSQFEGLFGLPIFESASLIFPTFDSLSPTGNSATGWNLVFGDANLVGWIGVPKFEAVNLILPSFDSISIASDEALGLEFLLFQIGFAATAVTIVSGAMAERMNLRAYLLVALLVSVIIYPMVAHWVWATSPIGTGQQTGWLGRLGFHDFAGSTVVHLVGAIVAFWGVRQIRPRLDRNKMVGRKRDLNWDGFEPSNLGYSMLGVFLLMLGWWGFNGGSAFAYGAADSKAVSEIILNTTVAGAAGGLAALFEAIYRVGRPIVNFPAKPDEEQHVQKWRQLSEKFVYTCTIGGTLGGMVAITACCDLFGPKMAMLIGFVAGLVHNYALRGILRLRLDDAVGAIPVHGACGIFGTLMVAFSNSSPEEIVWGLVIQSFGIIVIIVSVSMLSSIIFWAIDQRNGLRVDPEDERDGIIIGLERSSFSHATKPQFNHS